MARAAVSKRLNGASSDRKDILNRLLEARDENGEPLSFDELVAEAISMLIGVSSLYHLAKYVRLLTHISSGIRYNLQHIQRHRFLSVKEC